MARPQKAKELQPFMERSCDSRAGYKHHLTRDYLNYLKQEVMDFCHREQLHQVNLFAHKKKNHRPRISGKTQRTEKNGRPKPKDESRRHHSPQDNL